MAGALAAARAGIAGGGTESSAAIQACRLWSGTIHILPYTQVCRASFELERFRGNFNVTKVRVFK